MFSARAWWWERVEFEEQENVQCDPGLRGLVWGGVGKEPSR